MAILIDPVLQCIEEDGVPAVFFSHDFDLSRPELFSQILSPEGIKASTLMQEKLTHYLDNVEMRLSNQVVEKSAQAFESMAHFKQVMSELTGTIPCVVDLQTKVKRLDTIISERPLAVNMLLRRRANLMSLHRRLEMLSDVKQSFTMIQALIDDSNYVTAMEMIKSTKELIQSQLSGVECVKNLMEQMEAIVKHMTTSMEDEFINVIRDTEINLEHSIDIVEKREDGLKAVREKNSELFEKLAPVVHGLIKNDQMLTALAAYKEYMCSRCKDATNDATNRCLEIIRSEIGNGTYPYNFCYSLPLLLDSLFKIMLECTDVTMNNLSPEQFALVISFVFNAHYHIIEKTVLINHVVREISNHEEIKKPFMPSGAFVRETDKVLESVCEISHMQCSQLFISREADIRHFSKDQLCERMELGFQFITRCEQLSGRRRIDTFRGTLSSQGVIFLDQFHRNRKEKLSLVLQQENWSWKQNVSPLFQQGLNDITQTKMRPSEELLENIGSNGDTDNTMHSTAEADSVDEKQATQQKELLADKYLNVGGEKFPVAGCVLVMIQIIKDYVDMFSPRYHQFIHPLDLASRVLQLLSLFNADTRDLVLGARAIGGKSGLKTISVKHLMLASECLNCVVHIVPLLRQKLEGELQEKQRSFLSNFDTLASDCEQHKYRIYEKVQDIMKDRLIAHSTAWMKHNWDDDRVTVPSAAMYALLKDIPFLAKVLNTFLSTHPAALTVCFLNEHHSLTSLLTLTPIKTVYQKLFSRIILLYVNQLKSCIERMRVGSLKGKRRMLDDVNFASKNIHKYQSILSEEVDVEILKKTFEKHHKL